MRILVTGSRDWTDAYAVGNALAEARDTPRTDPAPPSRMVLVSGACPTGADAIAEHYALLWGWIVERYPADWDQHGRAAGPKRNAEMVAAGADLCLAFIGYCSSPRCARPGPHWSHGATGCADLAEQAGIPTIRRYAT